MQHQRLEAPPRYAGSGAVTAAPNGDISRRRKLLGQAPTLADPLNSQLMRRVGGFTLSVGS